MIGPAFNPQKKTQAGCPDRA